MNIHSRAEPMLREWGAQRRRVMNGRIIRKDGTVHEDGWPSISSTALPAEGGLTGGSGSRKQHFPEVYTGDAILVWRVFRRMPIEWREVLHMHYVVNVDAQGMRLQLRHKLRILAMSRTEYFSRMREAESYLLGQLDAETDRKPFELATC